MSDPLDEFFDETEIIEKKPSRPTRRRRSGGFLNILSGIFVAGTIVVGLLFTIIFINPQISFNPLPPTTMPALALVLTDTPSPTPKAVLPQTWTPTISPTDIPSSTPLPTDTPVPTIENPSVPTADPESGGTYGEQDGSPTSEANTAPTDAETNSLGVAEQNDDMDGQAVSTPLATQVSQTQVGSALTTPHPSEQFLTKKQPPDDGISVIFTPEIQYWEEEILAWGVEYGLDPDLIATVMQLESCGYVKAKSVADAKGLFQVMPVHFKEEEDPYDPVTNAYRGLSWLQRTLKSGGSAEMALAGYHAGIARAKNPDLEWSNETQRYVNWGTRIYQDTKDGYIYSAALHHWLSKGGSSLCNKAAAEQQDK